MTSITSTAEKQVDTVSNALFVTLPQPLLTITL